MSKRVIKTVLFTPRQISQMRAEKALAACLPEEWQDAWVKQFRYQNELLREDGEEPLAASEFIKCKLEDLVMADRSPF